MLKNYFFKNAAKIEQCIITNEEEFNEKNIRNKFFQILIQLFVYFNKLQLIINKNILYLELKFDDIYIHIPEDEEENDNVKIIIYEKTYLFISNEPLCKIF